MIKMISDRMNRTAASITSMALRARRPARGVEFLEWAVLAFVLVVLGFLAWRLFGDAIGGWLGRITGCVDGGTGTGC